MPFYYNGCVVEALVDFNVYDYVQRNLEKFDFSDEGVDDQILAAMTNDNYVSLLTARDTDYHRKRKLAAEKDGGRYFSCQLVQPTLTQLKRLAEASPWIIDHLYINQIATLAWGADRRRGGVNIQSLVHEIESCSTDDDRVDILSLISFKLNVEAVGHSGQEF
jgi:hypothetical protein